MEFLKTDIEGLMIVRPRVFEDSRGYFFESFSQREFDAVMPGVRFVQDNESRSSYGVVRGLHFQKAPYAQGKLTRCVLGRVLDVAMDLREGSATYGKYVAVELSEENHLQLWVPAGFAHGFSVLSPAAVFQYKCDEFYHPETEDGYYPLSPALGIDWQVPVSDMILSDKDRVRKNFDF
jgi:dTDP-4-dehydrorhamnose 3,5-epimerase